MSRQDTNEELFFFTGAPGQSDDFLLAGRFYDLEGSGKRWKQLACPENE